MEKEWLHYAIAGAYHTSRNLVKLFNQAIEECDLDNAAGYAHELYRVSVIRQQLVAEVRRD